MIKLFGLIALITGFLFNPIMSRATDEYDDLSFQIEEIKSKLDQLSEQAAVYQKNIRIKQEEAMSLKNQIDILQNKIAESELEIKATTEEIKKNELEIRKTEIDIFTQEDAITKKQSELAATIKQINKNRQTNALEIFILHNSISDFFIHAENTKILSKNLKAGIDKVQEMKHDLVIKKSTLTTKIAELKQLKDELILQRNEITTQTEYKNNLLVDTKKSEQKFYNLFWQAKQEQEQANAEVAALEKKMRESLKKNEEKHTLIDSSLIWPIPQNTVTTLFHDPDYPFRYLFEHPAIDIRAGQGTPIKAPADGYVLKVKSAGMGYSYIALIHANGISTVYGHVSKIYVKPDEYVTRGEVIGATGGAPRTPGAGNLTTGPHLHFEVHLNGIPVDPLLYLP